MQQAREAGSRVRRSQLAEMELSESVFAPDATIVTRSSTSCANGFRQRRDWSTPREAAHSPSSLRRACCRPSVTMWLGISMLVRSASKRRVRHACERCGTTPRNHIVPSSFLTSAPSIGMSPRAVARQRECGGIRAVHRDRESQKVGERGAGVRALASRRGGPMRGVAGCIATGISARRAGRRGTASSSPATLSDRRRVAPRCTAPSRTTSRRRAAGARRYARPATWSRPTAWVNRERGRREACTASRRVRPSPAWRGAP